jgi:hypothetical protein
MILQVHRTKVKRNGKHQPKTQGNGDLNSSTSKGHSTDPNLFIREDWSHFRTLQGLSQKSGVPLSQLRRLVAKELCDNGLDVGAHCKVGEMKAGSFFVQDDGPGIPGSPEDIARLFSIKRPLTSSKMIRLPSRGCLGNGLRVVAGSVLASGGKLRIFTRNMRLDLTPLENGETQVECKPCKWPQGTRVEVRLGDTIPEDVNFLDWANFAIQAAAPVPFTRARLLSFGMTPIASLSCCKPPEQDRCRK